MLILLFAWTTLQSDSEIRVGSVQELRAAIERAKPGHTIMIAAGDYAGGLHFSNLHGAPGKPVLVRAADASNPPRFVGGGSALQFSRISHVEIADLVIEGARGNGLNIDDGGNAAVPSHHVVLRNLIVRDLPPGNHDGIKLSGVDDFLVQNCRVENWGGSAIDMVGCHRGVIVGCTFRKGGDSGVQAKGGSSNVVIRKCHFAQYGQRGVNIGGSTGLEYFRPALDRMPEPFYEARTITVEGCTFLGGVAPVAFVGCDGATVRFNTILHPEKWALRILQETRAPKFVSCRKGVFECNLLVFGAAAAATGLANVGPGTSPETFAFRNNFWYCAERPEKSAPRLPTREEGGKVGLDPLLILPDGGEMGVRPDSPAKSVGAHAFASAGSGS